MSRLFVIVIVLIFGVWPSCNRRNGPLRPTLPRVSQVVNELAECPATLRVNEGFSKDGKHITKIRAALSETLRFVARNSACAAWLGGIDEVEELICDLVHHDLVGHSTFDPTLAAFVGIGCTDLRPGSAALVANRSGAFFNSGYTVGGFEGNTMKARVHILLHELAHLMSAPGLAHLMSAPGFKADYRNPQASADNDELVRTHCTGALGRVR